MMRFQSAVVVLIAGAVLPVRGQGLIELSTVTAIQGELGASAASSGLAVLDRTRLNVVQSEMRTIANQLEAYRADNAGQFPVCTRVTSQYGWAPGDQRFGHLWSFVNTPPSSPLPGNLQTPTAYMTSMPRDPYSRPAGRDLPYCYFVDRATGSYLIWSAGPDNDYDVDPIRDFDTASGALPGALRARMYDTNDPNDTDGDLLLTNRSI